MSALPARRVAVTGLGAITSLGRNFAETYQRLVAGDSGIAAAPASLGLLTGAKVVAGVPDDYDPLLSDDDWGPERGHSRADRLALIAAREALHQAKLETSAELEVIVGETTGATREAVRAVATSPDSDEGRALTRLVQQPLCSVSESLRQQIPGVNSVDVVCSACSSGALAIALGAMRLEQGSNLPQLVGGTDALSALTLVGFGALGALSAQGCKPFDQARSGLTLGEGAAFMVLESEEMAKARDARVLAWLDGYAVGAEAHHLTHPEPDGTRASELLTQAVRVAGQSLSTVDYINAHGTATLANDAMEALAIRRLFLESFPGMRVSSSKGQLGHTLGAAGAIEACIVVQSLVEQIAPPTVGLEHPAVECELPHVFGQGEAHRQRVALSSSFGFGGAGAVLCFAVPSTVDARPRGPRSIHDGALSVDLCVTLGPSGLLVGDAMASLVCPACDRSAQVATLATPDVVALPFEPLEHLVMERSRRFDRLTAMTALACARLLETDEAVGRHCGLVVGNVLGDVERTAAFLKRVMARGPKGAHPAEFPHLLASAVSGNASIYAGLRGPAFNVSDAEDPAAKALELAWLCLRAGTCDAMIAGAVEAISERILAAMTPSQVKTLVADGGFPETGIAADGAGFLRLRLAQAPERAAGVGARRPGCLLFGFGRMNRVQGEVTLRFQGSEPRLPLPGMGAEVLWDGRCGTQLDGFLASLGWDSPPRWVLKREAGGGWHRSALLFSAAAARIQRGLACQVLVVCGPPHAQFVALFVEG